MSNLCVFNFVVGVNKLTISSTRQTNEEVEIQTLKEEAMENKILSAITASEERLTQNFSAKIDGVESSLTQKIDGVDEKLTSKIDGVETRFGTKLTDGLNSVRDEIRQVSNRLETYTQEQRIFNQSISDKNTRVETILEVHGLDKIEKVAS